MTAQILPGAICKDCGILIDETNVSWNRRMINGYHNQCRSCINSRRRERGQRRRVGLLPGEAHLKLPHYPELRRLVVDEGLSYAEIGARFDVTKSTVARTVQRRAVKRSDWPLPINQSERIRRAQQKTRIKPDIVLDMLRERFDRASDRYVESYFEGLLAEGAGRAEAYRKAQRLVQSRIGLIHADTMPVEGFCLVYGIGVSYVKELLRATDANQMVSKAYLVTLLKAMGEPVPDALRPTRRNIKHQGLPNNKVRRRRAKEKKRWLEAEAEWHANRQPGFAEAS